jgi:hypothetical protein
MPGQNDPQGTGRADDKSNAGCHYNGTATGAPRRIDGDLGINRRAPTVANVMQTDAGKLGLLDLLGF